MPTRHKVSLLLRLAAIAVCIQGAFAGRPPVHAQDAQSQQERWMMSSEDPVQDTNIAATNKHLEHTDDDVRDLQKRLGSDEREMSGMEGQQQVYFWLLGVLVTGSIGVSAFQFTRGKKAP